MNNPAKARLSYMVGSGVRVVKELRPHLTVVALHMVVLVHRNHPDGFLRALEGHSSGKHQSSSSSSQLSILQLHNILRPRALTQTHKTNTAPFL